MATSSCHSSSSMLSTTATSADEEMTTDMINNNNDDENDDAMADTMRKKQIMLAKASAAAQLVWNVRNETDASSENQGKARKSTRETSIPLLPEKDENPMGKCCVEEGGNSGEKLGEEEPPLLDEENKNDDNELLAEIFLRTMDMEKQLNWWHYPETNDELEMPLCWLLLSISFLANTGALYSSDFPQHFFAFFFSAEMATLFLLIFHAAAAAGLWMRLPLLMMPCLGIYFAFCLLSFAYLLYMASILALTDESPPICFLLAPLLPLNAWTSKTLLEAYLLLGRAANKKRHCKKKSVRRRRAEKELFAANPKKVPKRRQARRCIDHFQRQFFPENISSGNYVNLKKAEEDEENDGFWGRNEEKMAQNEEEEESDSNLTQFYGQIAERPAAAVVENNTMNNHGNDGGENLVTPLPATIVRLPNGEVRKRRLRKRKKTASTVPRMPQVPANALHLLPIEESTSAAEATIEENNRNAHLGIWKTTENEEIRGIRKAPIPRPRTFRTPFSAPPPHPSSFIPAPAAVIPSPMSPMGGYSTSSVLASPMSSALLELFRETEV